MTSPLSCAKLGDEFTLSLAKNFHNWRWVYTFPCQKLAQLAMSLHFPLPKLRNFRFPLHISRLSLFKWSPLWRWNSQWVHIFRCQKKFAVFVSTPWNGAFVSSRATSDRKPKTNDQILPSSTLFFLWKKDACTVWKLLEKMKNDATFVRMRSDDHLGDTKMSKKGASLRRI